MKEVHWTQLQPGDVASVRWADHHDWGSEAPEELRKRPRDQTSYCHILDVTPVVVEVEYDHDEEDDEPSSGGTILGMCIIKAIVYGRVDE